MSGCIAGTLVHVITGLDTGGAETMLCRLAPRSDFAMRQVVVSLRPGGTLRPALEEAGVPVFDLGLGRLPAPAALLRLRRILAAERPAVVQSWMYHADLAAALAVHLLPSARRPLLCWGIRCSDMDVSRYGRQLRMVIAACARLSRWPDAIIANSEAGRRVHGDLGYRPRRFEVVWNGLDLDRLAASPDMRAAVRAELGLTPQDRVVAAVARVDAMKDHATLLAALDRVPDLRLLLIGLGTEALPPHPRALGLGRRTDVPRLLSAADGIVSSSAFGEGFSNALAEGMAAGCVPVGTDVGDTRPLIGDTGWVVPPRDAAALAEALTALRDLAPDALQAAGARAARRAHDHFSLDGAVRRFGAVYAGLGAPLADA